MVLSSFIWMGTKKTPLPMKVLPRSPVEAIAAVWTLEDFLSAEDQPGCTFRQVINAPGHRTSTLSCGCSKIVTKCASAVE